VGPETPVSPCSKSTTYHLIQVPCLYRGYHAGFPPFLHPSPSIFSIFPPLFPPCSIIAMPSLPSHRTSPPTTLIRSSLSFPFPFLFFFFFSPCLPPLRLSPMPSSPVRCAHPFQFSLLTFVVFFFFFFFFFFLQFQPPDPPPFSFASSCSPWYPYHSRDTSEMQNKGNAM
jgi:hypothetical protein